MNGNGMMQQAQKRGPGRPPKSESEKTGKQFLQITIHLPPELVKELDEAATEEGAFSRSALIRQVCGDYLKRRRKQRPGGAGAAA